MPTGGVANWKIERAVAKLEIARNNFWPFYGPYPMVDAVNELRGMFHADTMLALNKSYDGEFDFGFFDTLVPLVFEANLNCPDDRRWTFKLEEGGSGVGKFEMKDDLPALIGWYQYRLAGCHIPTTPLYDAKKWGGFLNPRPRQGPVNKRPSRDDIKYIDVSADLIDRKRAAPPNTLWPGDAPSKKVVFRST